METTNEPKCQKGKNALCQYLGMIFIGGRHLYDVREQYIADRIRTVNGSGYWFSKAGACFRGLCIIEQILT